MPLFDVASPFGVTTDPARQYHFVVHFPTDLTTFDQSYVKEVAGLPLSKIGSVNQRQVLHPVNYPDKLEYGDLTITFYEDTDNTITNYFYEWRSKIITISTGAYGMPSEYKKDIWVERFDTKNQIINNFIGSGCWPEKMTGLQFKTIEGFITPTITFKLDTMEPDDAPGT